VTAKAISFTPEVLKAKLRALEEYGLCQTRRRVDPLLFLELTNPDRIAEQGDPDFGVLLTEFGRPPIGDTGQRLWLRERARVLELAIGGLGRMVRLAYDLDGIASTWLPYPARLKEPVVGHCIPNGVHREGARNFLEVVEVRAERVVEISEQDAILEGVDREVYEAGGFVPSGYYRAGFFLLYDSIYGAGAHARDWCWVYTLKRAEP
jgi:hypothetical protein